MRTQGGVFARVLGADQPLANESTTCGITTAPHAPPTLAKPPSRRD